MLRLPTSWFALLLGLALSPALVGKAAAAAPTLAFPLACVIGQTCEVQHYVDRDPGPAALDYRCGHRTYQGHSGVDLRILDMAAQRRGVAVLAAAAGRVSRLRDGEPDISIRAPGAPPLAGRDCGNGVVIDHGDGWETQYCHLARGSVRVKAGDVVAAGQPIAAVGLSGNTEFPHLHLTVRHAGQTIDPFAPDMDRPTVCRSQTSLWSAAALKQMSYKAGALLNAGFSSGPVSMDQVEDGAVAPATRSSPALIAYGRAIELAEGDVIALRLTGPDGAVIAESKLPPLDHDKAQHLAYIGHKRPLTGWAAGTYTLAYQVYRDGRVVIDRRIKATL